MPTGYEPMCGQLSLAPTTVVNLRGFPPVVIPETDDPSIIATQDRMVADLKTQGWKASLGLDGCECMYPPLAEPQSQKIDHI
jgi:hypothetical protein